MAIRTDPTKENWSEFEALATFRTDYEEYIGVYNDGTQHFEATKEIVD